LTVAEGTSSVMIKTDDNPNSEGRLGISSFAEHRHQRQIDPARKKYGIVALAHH
jgi:hypothetical protein